MAGFLDWIFGWTQLRVTGASPEELLNRCTRDGLRFWAVECGDEITLTLRTAIKTAPAIIALGEGCCCEVELIAQNGAPVAVRGLKARAVLWVLPLIMTALVAAASFFVWDIKIDGAGAVSETEIRNVLAQCGVGYGSFWPGFEADMIRSRVLLELPELKWVGLQVNGSSVTVQVREAQKIPELFDPAEPARIVASQSGIIERLGAERGMQLFKDGDTALEGETLIDGVVVSTFDGRARIVHARGTVLARTWYEISAIMPLQYEEKLPVGGERRQYSLLLGGKRINFYSCSRILQGDCDIIVKEYNLGIKGLFSLPVSLLCQSAQSYETVQSAYSEAELRAALEAALNAEVRKHIGDEGEIRDSSVAYSQTQGFAVATLRCECLQNIADEEEIPASEIENVLRKEEPTE